MQADHSAVCALLKTARGQIDGILRMVEEDRYCIDVSNQILATQNVLKRANREILRAHMGACVKRALEEGGAEEKIEELLDVLDKMTK
jgi:DNA-binding FrmR family transcriptional regulator